VVRAVAVPVVAVPIKHFVVIVMAPPMLRLSVRIDWRHREPGDGGNGEQPGQKYLA